MNFSVNMLNELVTSNDVIWYSKCDCGAITIQTALGYYSCKLENFNMYFPNVDLRKCKRTRNTNKTYCCDYCVNGYGLDLCSCGSGESLRKCKCGSNKPMQLYGYYERVVCENPWGLRRIYG